MSGTSTQSNLEDCHNHLQKQIETKINNNDDDGDDVKHGSNDVMWLQ